MRNYLFPAFVASVSIFLGSMAQAQPTTYSQLGVYVGNANGNVPTAETQFEASYAAFTSSMGQGARTMDVFVDYTLPITQWVSNAQWQAWSMKLSQPVNNLIPVVSVGLADAPTAAPGGNWNEAAAVHMMNAIAAGTYDSIYSGILQAYKANGYSTIYLRPGWEMNGGWEPWYATADATDAAAYRAAFQHIAAMAHNTAGMNIKVVWSPSIINWTAVDVTSTYPGDAYVDVVGPDLYSTISYAGDQNNSDFYDWQTHSFDPTLANWMANPVNREHYWDYPGANEWNTQAGWGMLSAIAFAKAHGKSFGLSETGAGNYAGHTNGIQDDGDFPLYLANRLTSAIAQGVSIEYVNVWDIDVGDGSWDFSDGSKPLEVASWHQFAAIMAAASPPNTSLSPPMASTPASSNSVGTSTAGATPGNVSGVVQGTTTASSMVISWPPVAGATGYNVGFHQSNGTSSWTSVPVNSTSYTLTGLTANTLYWIEVQATNGTAKGVWTNVYSFQTSSAVLPPATVVNVAQSATTASGMTISWPAVSGATGYNIGFQSYGSQWSSIPTNVTTHSFTGLASNTWYWIEVQATSAAGKGLWTGVYSFKTANPAAVPGNVTNLLQGATTSTSMAISWPSVSGATSYNIGFQGSNGGQWSSTSTSTTSHTFTGLAPNTWYWLEVQGVNSVGAGAWTEVYSFKTN